MTTFIVDPDHFAVGPTDGTGVCAEAGCHTEFRCRHAIKNVDGGLVQILDRACPNCGGIRLWRWSGDPETTILGAG